MAPERRADMDGYLYRRRASDRARERAGRAAYYGDRAGLLIATSTAAALTSERITANRTAHAAIDELIG
jgi:hypothetical protein